VTRTPSDDSAASPVQVLAEPGQGKQWRTGTLTYTSGGLLVLFVWLLGGDFAWQLRDRALSPTMPLILRRFGGSDFLAGLLIGTLPAAMGVVLSPIISYWSDRHRGRLGRRIPFLLFTTPFAVVGMLGLAFTPQIGGWVRALTNNHLSQTVCAMGVFTLFWMLFEVAAIVCLALHGALVNDVVPRPVLGKFFGLFRMVSLGAGILFYFFFLGKAEEHYKLVFISLGLLYGVTFAVMCLKVKEGQYPPAPPPMPGGIIGAFFRAIASYFQDCFTKPYYLWFFLANLLAYMAFTPINLFSVFYAKSVGMDLYWYGKFSALQLALSMIQAPILGWLCDKFNPLRMTIFALCMYAITTLLAFFFVRDFRTFAAAHVLCGTCSGIWLTTTAPLGQVILPKMKFATFASAMGIFGAFGQMITAPIVGWILDRINGDRVSDIRDYHHIYLWATCFITLSMLVMLVVLRYFKSYGGTRNYVAPE